MEDSLYLELTFLLFQLVILRFLYLIHKISTGHTAKPSGKRARPVKTAICIGSGGHTTEMLQLCKQLRFEKYSPRYYIVAKTDQTSLNKIKEVELSKSIGKFEIVEIPRSRIVGQSYTTSVLTTLYSILYSIPVIIKIRPDVVLCNGPGTCIPICIITFILKAVFICDCRIVFIESFCRTKTFSLTAKILFYIADNILVQWPLLTSKLKRATYIGQLL